MSEIKAVIFDWAGTVIDFGSRAPVLAMMSVFEQAGVPLSENDVRQFMGMGKRDHVIAILRCAHVAQAWQAAHGPTWSEQDVDALMAALEPAMADAAATYSDLIPGALETVSWLRRNDVKIGSTTGYTRPMMAELLRRAEAQGYVPDIVVCSGDTQLDRPAPLMVWQVLAMLEEWPVCQCVKVDDAPVGIAAGHNAGLWTVGVIASGNALGMSHDEYQSLEPAKRQALLKSAADAFRQAGADYVVESVADLPRVIEIIEVRLANNAKPGQIEMTLCL